MPRAYPRELTPDDLHRRLIVETLRELGRPETSGAIDWLTAPGIAPRRRPRAAETRALISRMVADGTLRPADVVTRRPCGPGWMVVTLPGYELTEGVHHET